MQITFHNFNLGDVDDVDIFVAQPIYEWQQTEQGRWVMEHARNVKYYSGPDFSYYGYRVAIRGEIDEGPLLTEYLLRWPNKDY